jgi:hypothetical protein
MTEAFDTAFEDLPEEIAIFPLPRVILLPRVQMPLNIFEPRYLAMTRQALAGARLIGIVQPEPGPKAEDSAHEKVFKTGCAGRITSFSETEDGRYLVTLRGICRFNLGTELPQDPDGFRRMIPDWGPYRADFAISNVSDICRDALMKTLRAYFDKRGMFCDKWETMKDISCEQLVSTLSVVCPMDTDEKQALLEAQTLKERARLLQCFLENALKDCKDTTPAYCH